MLLLPCRSVADDAAATAAYLEGKAAYDAGRYHEAGGKVRKICKAGCIGCKICENKFPASGCHVESFLSGIDYPGDAAALDAAAGACPQKCIVRR